MPIYLLNEQISFPNVEGAEDGIVAVGGDLSAERLLLAYSKGIFPWYDDDDPIIWWSPDPRYIFRLSEFYVSKSFKRFLNKKHFDVTLDTCFAEVIAQCALIERKEQDGTWITEEMKEAYIHLHEIGFAHSVEVWENGELVGGMYGVSLGNAFFGESMFSKKSNASKTALFYLVQYLKEKDFSFIDAQIHTPHTESLGAKAIRRKDFIELLKTALEYPTLKGKWQMLM